MKQNCKMIQRSLAALFFFLAYPLLAVDPTIVPQIVNNDTTYEVTDKPFTAKDIMKDLKEHIGYCDRFIVQRQIRKTSMAPVVEEETRIVSEAKIGPLYSFINDKSRFVTGAFNEKVNNWFVLKDRFSNSFSVNGPSRIFYDQETEPNLNPIEETGDSKKYLTVPIARKNENGQVGEVDFWAVFEMKRELVPIQTVHRLWDTKKCPVWLGENVTWVGDCFWKSEGSGANIVGWHHKTGGTANIDGPEDYYANRDKLGAEAKKIARKFISDFRDKQNILDRTLAGRDGKQFTSYKTYNDNEFENRHYLALDQPGFESDTKRYVTWRPGLWTSQYRCIPLRVYTAAPDPFPQGGDNFTSFDYVETEKIWKLNRKDTEQHEFDIPATQYSAAKKGYMPIMGDQPMDLRKKFVTPDPLIRPVIDINAIQNETTEFNSTETALRGLPVAGTYLEWDRCYNSGLGNCWWNVTTRGIGDVGLISTAFFMPVAFGAIHASSRLGSAITAFTSTAAMVGTVTNVFDFAATGNPASALAAGIDVITWGLANGVATYQTHKIKAKPACNPKIVPKDPLIEIPEYKGTAAKQCTVIPGGAEEFAKTVNRAEPVVPPTELPRKRLESADELEGAFFSYTTVVDESERTVANFMGTRHEPIIEKYVEKGYDLSFCRDTDGWILHGLSKQGKPLSETILWIPTKTHTLTVDLDNVHIFADYLKNSKDNIFFGNTLTKWGGAQAEGIVAMSCFLGFNEKLVDELAKKLGKPIAAPRGILMLEPKKLPDGRKVLERFVYVPDSKNIESYSGTFDILRWRRYPFESGEAVYIGHP